MSMESFEVGTILDVPDPAEVTRPDGATVNVIGGRYVVEIEGPHSVRSPDVVSMLVEPDESQD